MEDAKLEGLQLEPLLEGYLSNEDNRIEAFREGSLIDRIGRNRLIVILVLIIVIVAGLIFYNLRKVKKIRGIRNKGMKEFNPK